MHDSSYDSKLVIKILFPNFAREKILVRKRRKLHDSSMTEMKRSNVLFGESRAVLRGYGFWDFGFYLFMRGIWIHFGCG